MARLLLITVCSLLLPVLSQAQNLSWRQHVKLADKLAQQRNYANAADHYEKAWRAKPENLELIYKAGENYAMVRDFKRAADAYSKIKKENETFDQVGFKYAKSLKQTGQYDSAIREFIFFINAYQGDDKYVLSEVIQQEIKGCEMAIQQKEVLAEQGVVVDHLSENVNSLESEFAPIAYSDDLLYFSSLKLGKAKIFRSQLIEGKWAQSNVSRGFNTFKDSNFCNGSFSTDNKRFYFTICDEENAPVGLTARCEIYVSSWAEGDNQWTEPVLLSKEINMDVCTNTHPFAVIDGEKEILYFASNRKGGKGGMDIWFVERWTVGSNTEFGLPRNAGPIVNTIGDEITPFYDVNQSSLYFSSNGHINIGGYDIIQVTGKGAEFSAPTNLGMPINSPADDNYYVHLYEGAQGFFVSNRMFGMDKVSTTQEDIFSFNVPIQRMMVKGQIYDLSSELPLENVEVALYEIQENQDARLWVSNNVDNGNYSFQVFANKNYEIRLEKDKYRVKTMAFQTNEGDKSIYDINLFMEQLPNNNPIGVASTDDIIDVPEATPETVVEQTVVNQPESSNIPSAYDYTVQEEQVVENLAETSETLNSYDATESFVSKGQSYETTETYETPTINTAPVSESVITYTEPDTYTPPMNTYTAPPVTESYTTTTSNYNSLPAVIRSSDPDLANYPLTSNDYNRVDNPRPTSKADAPSGDYYKIQLIAVTAYNPSHRRYRPVKGLGRIETEYFAGKDVVRVLLSNFFSEDEAWDMLQTVQDRGFEGAYIVKYNSGNRVRRIRD